MNASFSPHELFPWEIIIIKIIGTQKLEGVRS